MYHACYVQITENGSGASVYQIVTRAWLRQAVRAARNPALARPVRPSAVRSEQREQDRFADARAGEQHEQAVDAEPHTAHRRCAEFEGREEVLVELHRLEVARRGRQGLLREAFALDDRIDELGEAGGALDA